MDATAAEKVGSDFDAHFQVDPQFPHGAADPVFGAVFSGWFQGMRAVSNPRLGIAQVTDGARVITPYGDGVLSGTRGYLRRQAIDLHVDLAGHRYTLHHRWPRRARLLRDGVTIGWFRRARSTSFFTGFFRGGWRPTYQVIRWSATLDAAGAITGHLLAAVNGVNGWRR